MESFSLTSASRNFLLINWK